MSQVRTYAEWQMEADEILKFRGPKMQEAAFSFPRANNVNVEEVAALVGNGARARNGCQVIPKATVIHTIRMRVHIKT